MNNLVFEFEFEDSALTRYLENLRSGGRVDAFELLALLEEEDEESVEHAFEILQEKGVLPDLTNLPRPQYDGDSGVRLKWERELSEGGQLLEKLDENDPLAVCLREIGSIPVCGDICLLSEQLGSGNRNGADKEKLRESILNLSLSRVVELAGLYAGRGVFLLDLIQEGSLAVWNYTAGCFGERQDFESARDWWIRFYMKKAIILQARESGVGQKLRTALEDYRTVDERLLAELGRNPTLEEIAEQLHMTPDTAAVIRRTLENARLLAQVKKAPEPEEEELAETQAVEDTAYFQMRQRISDLLSRLDETDRELLTLRYGLEGGVPLTPEETGKRLSLTPGEVISRETAALALLRQN